ncbi:MAG: GlxA family transcriptional regulator [Hyphomicrobiales bacterium]|nr:GlxA family transcriptional regulator [Hyphomicrobiales bacterium]
MMTEAPPRVPFRVGFFIVPDFPMLAFTAAIEALRVANWVSGRTLYEWVLISEDGGPVIPSSSIAMHPHAAMSDAGGLPIVFFCAGVGGSKYVNRRVFAWLRRLARNKVTLGSIGTGTYALARAGLLKGYRCTLHWEEIERFSREFPDLLLTTNLFEVDRDRMTCPGGTASLDMMFFLIQKQHGRDLAWDTAEELLQHGVRSARDPQRMSLQFRTRVTDPRLLVVIEAMENNVEDPLSLQRLCEISGLSLRHLQRRFRQVLGRSPKSFYRQLRLQSARKMLMHGTRSILDVAVANGFVSGSHFARRYSAEYGRRPREDRAPQP